MQTMNSAATPCLLTYKTCNRHRTSIFQIHTHEHATFFVNPTRIRQAHDIENPEIKHEINLKKM